MQLGSPRVVTAGNGMTGFGKDVTRAATAFGLNGWQGGGPSTYQTGAASVFVVPHQHQRELVARAAPSLVTQLVALACATSSLPVPRVSARPSQAGSTVPGGCHSPFSGCWWLLQPPRDALRALGVPGPSGVPSGRGTGWPRRSEGVRSSVPAQCPENRGFWQHPAAAPRPPKPHAAEGSFVSPMPSRYLLFSSSLFFPLHSSLKKTTDFPACLLVLY